MALKDGITTTDGLTPPVLNSPDLITSPYHQTTFLGATVTDFSGKLGFGTNSSEITIQLVEDTCATSSRRSYAGDGQEKFTGEGHDSEGQADNFIMPPVGTPKIFKYGSFQYGGLIKNVERSSSISKRGYTVRMESPTVVLSNAQVILQGLDDAFPSSENLINLHPGLTPPQKSWCNDVGVTWSHVLSVIEGHTFYHRGNPYTLLVAGAVPGCELRFGGDNVDVMAAIDRASVIKIFSDSGQGGTSISKTTAPGASDVNEGELTAETKLVKGSVYRTINKSSLGFAGGPEGGCETTGNLISLNYGVEAGEATTHAMVNGEFKHLIYSVDVASKIKQSYGFDPETDALIRYTLTPSILLPHLDLDLMFLVLFKDFILF